MLHYNGGRMSLKTTQICTFVAVIQGPFCYKRPRKELVSQCHQVLICSDGRLEAHQSMLARQSRSLKKLFLDRASLSSIQLSVPR